MRAAIYARVSSAGQREHKTIESQLRVLPEFVRSKGWELVGEYVDDGFTAKAGHLEERAGFTRLMSDMALGRFDVVVVVDVDRLTRSEDMIERYTVLGAFQRARVKIASVGQGAVFDLNTTEGDLGILVGSYFSAEWARKHRMRVVEGKLTAIARGKKPAGPTPYGYRYDRASGVWSIHEPEAAIVREIFDRALAGETGEAIATDLRRRAVPRPNYGAWSRERVYGVMKQPAYRGEWIADKARKLTVPTPPIVDPALWFACRDRDGSIARRGMKRAKHVYLLEGLAVCGLCGGAIGISSASFRGRTSNSPARYVCKNRRRPPIDGEACRLPYHLVADLDARVWGVIERLLLQPGRLERVARAKQSEARADGDVWAKDVKEAERRVAHLVKVEGGILARFRRGLITEEALDAELEAHTPIRVMAQQQLEAAQRARFAAGRAVARATELSALIETMRQRAAETAPAKRRELVLDVIPRGAVTISIAEVVVDLDIRKPAKGAAGSVGIAGYSPDDGTSIRIQVVA